MATTIRFGEAVALTDTTAIEFVIDTTRTYVSQPYIDLPITTAAGNAGTIQFQVGATPAAGQTAVAADKKILLCGVQNGLYNFWAKASAGTQTFMVG
jgi:hypothetical protein